MVAEYECVQRRVESALVCDRCKTKYEDVTERQEFLRYSDTAGYSSIFGDLNSLKLDLCQHCVKEVLGAWLRVEPSGIL